jgi:hypothetical protein
MSCHTKGKYLTEIFVYQKRRAFVWKRPINDTCTRETCELHVLPHKREISDWNLCILKETYICVKETFKRYLYKRNMWIKCLATQKGNVWLRSLYMERDLHVRKETYICGERPVKDTYTRETSELHFLPHKMEISGWDLCVWKETYMWGKRPIYVERDL